MSLLCQIKAWFQPGPVVTVNRRVNGAFSEALNPQEQINAAERAKTLLDDPLVSGALAEIEAAVMDQWASLPVADTAQAQKLKQLLWASRQFRAVFETTIANGSYAKSKLLAEGAQDSADAAKGKLYGTT